MKHHTIVKNILLILYCALCPSTILQSQEWQAPFDFESRVYELYPDTIDNVLYVGGGYRHIDNVYTGNLTAFDGVNFRFMLDSMNACWNGGCEGVASITRYKDDIIASLVRSDTYEAQPQVIGIGRWNGERWLPMGGGIGRDLQTTYIFPATAYDFCKDDDTLFIAGDFNLVDSIKTEALSSWDGTNWKIYDMPPSPPGQAILSNSIAKYKKHLYLGGNFIVQLDGESVADLMKFDGTSWSKVGDGLVDGWTNLHDIEIFQDKLYVAGYFTKFDGNPGNSIMSWDGEKWDDLGGGICSPFGAIDDLFVYKDKLYVAGAFECINGVEIQNLASWDGTRWCSVGHSVFNRAIHGVAVWRDTVYVGGSFYEIDGQPARYFARYVGDHTTDVCSEPVSSTRETQTHTLKPWPNPADDLLHIPLHGPAQDVHIFDVLGREVSGLQTELLDGELRLNLNGTPAGMYWIMLRVGGRLWSGKFVRS